MRVLIKVFIALFLISTELCSQYSLRFYGNGVNAPDQDRVKILIDDINTSMPGPPVDVGATDFTIEFWMKASPSDNSSGMISCSSNNWINGNIIIDRDRFNQGRNYGISIAGGMVVFGTMDAFGVAHTICGDTNVLDNQWHHVAVQRRFSDGRLQIFIDGRLSASADGPDGDISYPDDGVPGNYCGGPCDFSDPYIVLGAEKHDAGASYPSYSGFMDELRFSNILRYSTDFVPHNQPFVTDANTMGLYHFDEGQGVILNDDSDAVGGPSHGQLNVGGSPQGPVWTMDTPITSLSTDIMLFDDALEFHYSSTVDTFEIRGQLSQFTVELLDQMGNVQDTLDNSGTEIEYDLGALPSGLFFIRIRHALNENLWIQQLIKEE